MTSGKTFNIESVKLGYYSEDTLEASKIKFQGARIENGVIIWEMFGSSSLPPRIEKIIEENGKISLYMKQPVGIATCDMAPYREIISYSDGSAIDSDAKLEVYHWSGKIIKDFVN